MRLLHAFENNDGEHGVSPTKMVGVETWKLRG
jgi:hypothetical protein